MITVLSRKPDDLASPDVSKVNKEIIEYCGLSTDEKPNGLIVTGSTFLEIDTGDLYIYNEEAAEWAQFINIKDAAGGGGGSSDFTTCTMTLVDETAETLGVNMSLPLVMEEEGMTYLIAQLLSWPAGEYTVALCKGYAVGETNTSGVVDIAVTGDAQWNDGVLIVTGDFTLTGTDHSK